MTDRLTSTHWGTYRVRVEDGQVTALEGHPRDPDPSPIAQSMAGSLDSPLRIDRPMVRAGWLKHGPGNAPNRRGAEPFVAMPWDEALDLAAQELQRVRTEFGNQAIFGGSYGWSSAGRFHHAQSQVHRFLNCLGGYTCSVNTYSSAAGEVICPHVFGDINTASFLGTTWDVLAEHCDFFLAFGGVWLKNGQVHSGGFGRHQLRGHLQACRDAGVAFVSVSPERDDLSRHYGGDWLAARPNSDVALMLGLAHELERLGRTDDAFLDQYCVGFERFRPYLLGQTDGQPKTAAWAAEKTGLPAETIRALARRLADAKRPFIATSWSLQRARFGEQPYWMTVVLAAMLGQIGLPGGGFGFAYGGVNGVGSAHRGVQPGRLPQGRNPVTRFIPVARITDLLERPGGQIDYDGQRLDLPDIRLVYWCGGNPFHHHQDLPRLVRAWQRPDTVIVHEPWWNALAKHADIVFPAATGLERNDIAAQMMDQAIIAMKQAVPPRGESRTDYAIFSGLAERLGAADAFTEGRDEMGWLREIYAVTAENAAAQGLSLPSFEAFWEAGEFWFDDGRASTVAFDAFRADPAAHPLPTPSGRFELYSETIAGFGYEDCPGHPVWLDHEEWLGAPRVSSWPLHLLSNQPARRLHSQYDQGSVSRAGKIADREPVRMNPDDAEARGIAEGDVVRVFNQRGACLAGAVLSDDVMPGVVVMATGAWFDPVDPGEPESLCSHGNANAVTWDIGTSALAQGPSAQSCLVEVVRLDTPPPAMRAFDPPQQVSDPRDPVTD